MHAGVFALGAPSLIESAKRQPAWKTGSGGESNIPCGGSLSLGLLTQSSTIGA